MGEIAWACLVQLEKFGRMPLALVDTGRVTPLEVIRERGNKPTYVGLSTLIERLLGVTISAPFDHDHAYLGVGNSAAATAQTMMDLTGASTLRLPMADGYPIHEDATTGLAHEVIFRSNFEPGDAEFEWREVGVFNGPTGDVMLNRKPVDYGEKFPLQLWRLTITLCLYGTEEGTVGSLSGENPLADGGLPAGWNVLTIDSAFGVRGVTLPVGFVHDLIVEQACSLTALHMVARKGPSGTDPCDVTVVVSLAAFGSFPNSAPIGTFSIAGGNSTFDESWGFATVQLYKGDVLSFEVGGGDAETVSIGLRAIRTFDYEQVYGDDGAAPVITGMTVTNVRADGFDLSVTTGERVTGTVLYGTDATYGSSWSLSPAPGSESGVEVATDLVATLQGLAHNTLYHFAVEVIDVAGNRTRSGDQTVATLI